MDVVGEFLYQQYQYQEVSNGSWNFPMTGWRRRPLDSNGSAIGNWEPISKEEYDRASERQKRGRG